MCVRVIVRLIPYFDSPQQADEYCNGARYGLFDLDLRSKTNLLREHDVFSHIASNLFPIIESNKPDYIVTLIPDDLAQSAPLARYADIV